MLTVVRSDIMDTLFQIESNLCYSCGLLVVEMIQSNKIILILRFSWIFITNDCFATVSFPIYFARMFSRRYRHLQRTFIFAGAD